MLLLVALAPQASAGPADALAVGAGPVVETPSPVVNGERAERDRWDDAVGLYFFDYYVGCTGTLIGPKVVLTAGHCVNGYPVTSVVIGSTDWSTNQGEVIDVAEVHEYPDSQRTYDVGLLILEQKSSYEPRAVGLDCIVKDYLKDDARAWMVGYGVTDADGYDGNTRLNQGRTRILDRNCDEDFIDGRYVGCNEAVSPGGELAAGGDGGPSVCYGDSGGPLYLETDRGEYVVGIASRLWLGSDYESPCDDGGVWVRADAVIDWIEETAGRNDIVYPSCNAPPELAGAVIETWKDVPGLATLGLVDPDGDPAAALVEVVGGPAHGDIVVDGLDLVYTPGSGYVGADTLTLAITDAGTDQPRTGAPVTIEVEVPVTVNEGRPPGSGACGCRTASPGGLGALVLLLGIRARGARRG